VTIPDRRHRSRSGDDDLAFELVLLTKLCARSNARGIA
jgi:hypothetical protein